MDTQTSTIDQTLVFVRQELDKAEGGHDWWHIERVWRTAKEIASEEQCDLLVVELAALLHDIADSKFHDGDEEVGPDKAEKFLMSINIDHHRIAHIVNIIRHISFKGGNETTAFKSLELDIVQDADRLDALGAIGIARAFNFGGYKGRALYDPAIEPNLTMSKEEYKKSSAPTVNHFYEKLLLLKDRMNTPRGTAMAEARHKYMEEFLEEFYKEWSGSV